MDVLIRIFARQNFSIRERELCKDQLAIENACDPTVLLFKLNEMEKPSFASETENTQSGFIFIKDHPFLELKVTELLRREIVIAAVNFNACEIQRADLRGCESEVRVAVGSQERQRPER